MKTLFTVTGGVGAEHWASLNERMVEEACLASADDVAWDLVAEIEQTADSVSNDRWGHVARYFEPVPNGGGAVWIPSSEPEAREAFELEYGAEGRPPLPVVRTTIERTRKAHDQQWAYEFERRIFGG